MQLKYAAAAMSAVLPLCSAQTYSDCNPLKSMPPLMFKALNKANKVETCPPDDGMKSSTLESDFTKGESALEGWETSAGNVTFDDQGAAFTINQKGDAPTIDTKDYFLFGSVEVKMKVASGTGVVSSIVMESDVLDEIDWEGVGGNPNQIQTNYFGKGDTTTYDRETWVDMDNPQESVHSYTIDWSKDAISWIIDGENVRTVKYEDAKGGSRFPQTPMKLRLGIWAGGDPDNGQGTIEWAGGETDYTQAPFTMYVESVKIINKTPADSYKYTDNSGSHDSIKASNSTESSTTSSDSSSSTTSSSSSTSTDASSTSDSSSSASSTGGSSGSSSGSDGGSGGSASGTDSGTDSGSGSGSGSGTESGSAAESSPTTFEGAATSLASTYLAPAMMLALFTAMLQL